MDAWYNEFDANAVQWLRVLIAHKNITGGVVNDEDLRDLRPEDIPDAKRHHFFAGIGGWDLALQLAGWPPERSVWTASLPCQPFSDAGKKRGTEDERHLWPVFRNLVEECRPTVVFGEQVASKDGRAWLAVVFTEMEALGYFVAASDLCAAGVGAPHIRQRLYWAGIRRGGAPIESGVPGRAHGGVWLADTAGTRPQGCEPESERQECATAQRGGAAGGLENADGRDTEAKRLQRGGQHGLQPSLRGDVGGLAHDHGQRLPQRTQCDCGEKEPGRCASRGDDPVRCGAWVDGLPDTQRHGLDGTGTTGKTGRGELADMRGGNWRNVVWVPCADGKVRPLEPGTVPLVDGLPKELVRGGDQRLAPQRSAEARTMRLRGLGNAIVPQLGALFIETVMEYLE